MIRSHIPLPILKQIVTIISDEGVQELKNWILAGPEGNASVFTDETLHRVCLHKDPGFVSWSRPESSFHKFFLKCLKARNPYALYAESLRLAFCCGDLKSSIQIMETIKNLPTLKDLANLASLMFVILNHCSRIPWTEEEKLFREKHVRVREIQRMGEEIKNQINSLDPRNQDTYGRNWYSRSDPFCWEEHVMVDKTLSEFRRYGIEPDADLAAHYNGDRCTECIVYYLSREISKLA